MVTAATPEQNARYRSGQCIDCAGKPAAGMPRCYACHDLWKASQTPAPPFVIELTLTKD